MFYFDWYEIFHKNQNNSKWQLLFIMLYISIASIDIEIHSVLAGLWGKSVVPWTNYRPFLAKLQSQFA